MRQISNLAFKMADLKILGFLHRAVPVQFRPRAPFTKKTNIHVSVNTLRNKGLTLFFFFPFYHQNPSKKYILSSTVNAQVECKRVVSRGDRRHYDATFWFDLTHIFPTSTS